MEQIHITKLELDYLRDNRNVVIKNKGSKLGKLELWLEKGKGYRND